MKIDSYGVGPVQNHRNEPAAQPAVVHAQRGDRMADVAQRYGVDEGALRQANPQYGDQLLAGQQLKLPSSSQEAVQAAAATVGANNLREPQVTPAQRRERAMEGFRAADGLKPGDDVPKGSHTDLAQQAFERADSKTGLTDTQATQVREALLKVGAGLRDGGIEPNVTKDLREQIGHLATAQANVDPDAKPDPAAKATKKGGAAANVQEEVTSKFSGSLAQLTRTGQVAHSRELMPGTKVVDDGKAGSEMRGSGLPEINKSLHDNIDSDVYYRTRDGVLHVESSKANPSTLANAVSKHLKESKGDPATREPTQIERQQVWREAAGPQDPRALGYFVLEKQHANVQALLNPKNLDELAKAVGNEDARQIVVGDRRYSIGELRELGTQSAAEAAKGDFADYKAKWEGDNPGKKWTAAQFYKDKLDSTDKAMKYVGKEFGEPLREAAPLRAGQAQFQTGRQGAAQGAAIGGAVSVVRLGMEGKLTIEAAGQVAIDTGLGAATGAAAARGERAIAPWLDRKMGGAVERGTSAAARATGAHSMQAAERGLLARTLVTRAAGSTIVGTAISTGMSIVENRHGLAKGDSKAIGNVAADTVVGAGAVLGGMAAGAAVGSVVPVVGTAIGAVVGGAVVAWGAHASGARDAIAGGVSKATDWVKSWF